MSTEKHNTSGGDSPRGVKLICVADKKSSPNPEGRIASIGVSVGAAYYEGSFCEAIFQAVKKTGYKKCKVYVGGFLQRHNFIRKLAIQQALKKAPLINNKPLRDFTDEEIRALHKDTLKEAEEKARHEEQAWINRNDKYIQILRDAGIEVEIIPWEPQLHTESYIQQRVIINEEVKKQNGLNKHIKFALDKMSVAHEGECEEESYKDALYTHEKFFEQLDREYAEEELAVLDKNSDFIYPMEHSKVSKHVVDALQKLAEVMGGNLRVYSANFVSKKDVKKNNRQQQQQHTVAETKNYPEQPSPVSAGTGAKRNSKEVMGIVQLQEDTAEFPPNDGHEDNGFVKVNANAVAKAAFWSTLLSSLDETDNPQIKMGKSTIIQGLFLDLIKSAEADPQAKVVLENVKSQYAGALQALGFFGASGASISAVRSRYSPPTARPAIAPQEPIPQGGSNNVSPTGVRTPSSSPQTGSGTAYGLTALVDKFATGQTVASPEPQEGHGFNNNNSNEVSKDNRPWLGRRGSAE